MLSVGTPAAEDGGLSEGKGKREKGEVHLQDP
jgi:hypothetical protein